MRMGMSMRMVLWQAVPICALYGHCRGRWAAPSSPTHPPRESHAPGGAGAMSRGFVRRRRRQYRDGPCTPLIEEDAVLVVGAAVVVWQRAYASLDSCPRARRDSGARLRAAFERHLEHRLAHSEHQRRIVSE